MQIERLLIVPLLVMSGCFSDPAVLEAGDDTATDSANLSASGSGIDKPDPSTSGEPQPDPTTGGDEGTTGGFGGSTLGDDSTTTGDGESSSGGDTGSSSGGDESSSGGPPEDCAGVPGGDAELDACGVCNGPGGPCFGCTTPSASNYDPLAEVNDGTCTCTTGGGGASDQSNFDSNAGAGGQDQWQSFTAGLSAGLVQIDLGVGSPISGPSDGTLRIYEGEGTTGTLLGTQAVTFEDVHNQVQEFVLEDPVPMTAGQVYTVRFSVPAVTVGWVDLSTNDPYAGGRASHGAGADYVFRTTMAACIPD